MSTATALRERPRLTTSWQPPQVDPWELDLVARLLDDGAGEDAMVLATSLLHGCGGLGNLPSTSRSQLLAAGLSMAQAARLKVAVNLASRLAAAPLPGRPVDRAGATALFRPVIATLDVEELHVAFLAADGTFRGRQRLATGGFAALVVHARDVLAAALEARADAIVLAHNHPSGFCAPSPEDAAFSARLESACAVMGIRLLDHLVFARDGVASAMPDGAHWPATRPQRVI